MRIEIPTRRAWLLAAAATIPTLTACRSDQGWLGKCNDIPPGAVPRPAGSHVCEWQQAQAERADQDGCVFYQYEWSEGEAELGPFGRQHFERVARRAAEHPRPMVIEPSGNESLDAARVAVLKASIAERDGAWKEYPVLVATPEAEALYGFESPRIMRGFSTGVGGQGAGGGGGGGMMGGGMMGGGMGGGGMGGGIF